MAEIKVIKRIEHQIGTQHGIKTVLRYSPERLRQLDNTSLIRLRNRSRELLSESDPRLKGQLESRIKLMDRIIEQRSPAKLPFNSYRPETTRAQLLPGIDGQQPLPTPYRIESSLEYSRLKEVVSKAVSQNYKQPGTVDRGSLASNIAREIKVQAPNPTLEILARILIAQRIKSLLPEPPRRGENNTRGSEKDALANYLRSVLNAISRSSANEAKKEEKAAEEKAAEKKREAKQEALPEVASRSVSETAGNVVRFSYDSKGNIIKCEIIGKADNKQAVEDISNMAARDPKEAVLLITSLATSSPSNMREIMPVLNQLLGVAITEVQPNINYTPETVKEAVVHALLSDAQPASALLSHAEKMEIAQKMLQEDPKSIITAAREILSKPKPASFVKHLVRENQLKLAPQAMTFAVAKEFIELVSQLEKCFEAASIKEAPARAKPSVPKKATNYYQRYSPVRVNVNARANKEKPVTTEKLSEITKDIQRLAEIVSASNLLLPKEVMKQLQAGLAALKMPAIPGVSTNPLGNASLPEKSAYVSSMERIVQVLEGELRAVKEQNISGSKPVASVNLFIDQLAPSINRLPPLTALYYEIWRLTEKPTPEAAHEEIQKVELMLKNRLTAIAEGLKQNNTLATIPLYNAVNALRIKMIKDLEEQETDKEPPLRKAA